MKQRVFSLRTVVFAVLFFFSPVLQSFAFDPSFENVLLQGNWERLFKILSENNSKAKDPVARLIMGHVCLATNRNALPVCTVLA